MASCLASLVVILSLSSVYCLTTYECTDTTGSVIPIEIPIPGHRIAITSPNYPNTFDLTRLDCKWAFKALHGAKIRVQLVDSDLNNGCNDNILNVVDDTPKSGRSRLKYPGKSARCGQNDFKSVDAKWEASGETVTVSFKSLKNNGSATFKLEVFSFIKKRKVCPGSSPSGCLDGPCCVGADCCVISAGTEAQELSIPEAATPGLDCQYKVVAKTGTQIAVNFLEMDIHADENQDCLTDYVRLEETKTSASSLIGKDGLTFCGQRLPNYPGPSVIVSGGNSLVIKYHTDQSTAKKGSGFKAKVSAINPICNVMNFEYKYGEEVCNSTCGVPYEPTKDKREGIKPVPRTTSTTTSTVPTTTIPVRTINETCEEYDVDYLGNDIECFKNSSRSWEECAKTCNGHERCTHWTWLSEEFDTEDMVHACCIKTTDAGHTKHKGAVSGSKACGACEEIDIDLAGNDIDAVLDVPTWEQCSHICKQRSDCSFWTWVGKDYTLNTDILHKCHLKNGDSGRVKVEGLLSGSSDCGEWSPPVTTTPATELKNKTCESVDTKLISREPATSLEDVPTWEQCANLCAAVDTCSHWNFYANTSREVGNQLKFDVYQTEAKTECTIMTSAESDEAVSGFVSGTKDCGKAAPTTTTISTTFITTLPETTTEEITTTEGRRCDILNMKLQVINAETGGPLPKAMVRIQTRRVSRSQDIPYLKATHITDANGEVSEIGTLYGTYSFKVHMESGSDIFRTQVDRTINNATCTNAACTECSLSMKVLAEKEEQEVTVKPCTCKGQVTIVNVNTQQPIAGACVSYTVESPCQEMGTDLAGDDISAVLDVESWQKCSTLCAENSDCTFWTWVDKTYTRNPDIINKCHLKNGDSGRVKINGLISGAAGCGTTTEGTTTAPAAETTNSKTDAATVAETDGTTDDAATGNAETDAATGDAETDTARVIETDAPTDAATDAPTDAVTDATTDQDRFNGLPLSRSIILNPSNREDNNCRDNWCKFEATKSLFRYFESTTTWQEAHDVCNTFGAHLASIPSMNVNRFVTSILTEPEDGGYWIGGTQKDGQWVWGDASPWNYANWAEGEPNSNNENCVELKTDLSFNDVSCNSRRRFICKKKDVPKASSCELETDVDGKVSIDTYRAGKYVLTVSHEEYNTNVFTTDLLLGITDGKCDKCNTEVRWEMEKEFCNKSTNPINLKITVVNQATSDVIEGVQLTTYISEGTNTTSTITNENGTSLVPITEDGDYTIAATADGMQPVSIQKNIFCDPEDCGKCSPVATLYMVSAPSESTIPPTEETCTTKIENSLTVLPFDNSNDKPIPDAEISITYNGELIANKVGLTNSSYKTEITENGLYTVNGSAVGYVPKEASITTNCGSCQENDIDLMGNDIKSFLNIASWAECAELCKEERGCSHWTWVSQRYTRDPSIFNKCHLKNSDSGRVMTTGLISGGEDCDKTSCHNCINVIKLYMDPDVCDETDFKVSVFEAGTRTPIQGATVRITDVSEDSPQVISNHLVCPATNIEPCGWKDITEEQCGKKGCCSKTESCELVDIDLMGNDIKFIYNVSSWDECAKFCKEERDCSYWTWVSTRFERNPSIHNKCHLKNGDSGRVATTGLISGGADCDDVKCFKKIEGRPMTTDVNGMILAPSPGQAKLKIDVEKEGYEVMNGTADVFCQHPCDSCNPSFTAVVKQKLCEHADMIDMQVTVTDKDDIPIKEATVTMKLASSAAGASSSNTSETMITDNAGQVDPPILVSGTYIITATAEGYVTKTEEVVVDDSTACEKQHIPVTIPLNKQREEEDHCNSSTISIHVFDESTNLGIAGAKITITSDNEVVAKDETVVSGNAQIPVGENGEYTVNVAKEGFTEKRSVTTIQYPNSCNSQLELGVKEKTCPETIMPVVIINNATLAPIPNALVRVILTKSKAGPSMTTVDKPKYTDENGTAYFKTPMNGEYTVEVTVDGFDPIEVTEDLMCDTDNCAGCAPVVTIHTPPTYCPDKSLQLIIMDCKTNDRIALAEIVTTIHTTRGQIDGGKLTTSETGEISIPITENGIYNSIIMLDGYVTMKNSFEVAISMDDCDEFNPIDTVALCPPVEPGCTSVSLSWTNEKDMDLNGYRVNIKNRTDTCNTKPSCCEGCKKEECAGVTPSNDTAEGLSGTETITYCKTDDYSNMIFVSDPTGEGKFLPSSGAKLVIGNGDREQIVRIDATEQPTGSKYWLAGCLTTEENSFDFINLNKFTEDKPSENNPLFCYDRANIEKKTRDDATLEDAKIIVNIFDAETKAPITGAIAEASTAKESISRVSNTAGTTSIKVTKNGEYSVEASARGYVNSEASITIDCKQACELLDTDLAGNDIEAALDVPSWEECSDLCSKKRGCTVWTWVDSTYTINTGIINKCHLKDGSPGPSSVTGLVSGSAGCKPVEECENIVSFSLLPAGKTEKIEIVLNWGANASNLDLHTMQINKEAPGAGCETFFNKMVGCENTKLDGDKFNGGADGGEKITISNPAENLKYTYMIFVKDNSADTDELETSEAHIDISDGTKSLTKTLPKFTRDTPSGANFWFAGCLRTVGESYEFASVDTLSRDSPYRTQKLYCDNLFKKESTAGQEKTSEFCNNVNLKVRLQTDQDSAFSSTLSGCGANCTTVQIVSVGSAEQKTIFEGLADVDTVTVPITSNGKYLVKVDGDGYVATEEAFDVACDITKCGSCNPTFVLPLSPKLGSDEARIMLSWANLPNELQLSSFERGCEEIDTDFSGDDIDAVFDVKSSQACSEICKNKEGCSHWTWVGETYIKNIVRLHTCLLKNGDSGRRKETGLVSGKGGCKEYKPTAEAACELLDTDLAGNDIEAALDVPSWEECSDLCSKKRGCTVWTWVDSTYTINTGIINKCHLKDGSPGPSSVTGLVSGSAGCKPDLDSALTSQGWRTEAEISAMSENDKRNTIIVELNKFTGLTIEELQGKSNVKLLELVLSEDDRRNKIIVELNKFTGLTIGQLQGKSNLKLLELYKIPKKSTSASSISLSGVSKYMEGKVGMIFVENLSKLPKFSTESNIGVTITDGTTISKNQMDLTKYGEQDFWIAGCYRMDDGIINFSPEASFLNGRPDEEVPDYCVRFYGL